MEDVKVSSRSFAKKSKFRKAKGFHSTLIGIISLIIVSLSLVSYICFVERDEKFEDIEGNRHALASLSTGIGNEFSGFVSRRRLSEDDANKGDKRPLCSDGAQEVKARYTEEKQLAYRNAQRAKVNYSRSFSNLQLSAARLQKAVNEDRSFMLFELEKFRNALEETLSRSDEYSICRAPYIALFTRYTARSYDYYVEEKKPQLTAARVASELLLNSIKEGSVPDEVDLRWLAPFLKEEKTETSIDSKKEQTVQKTHHADDAEAGSTIVYTEEKQRAYGNTQHAKVNYCRSFSNLQLSAARLQKAVIEDHSYVLFELDIFRNILEETLSLTNAYQIAREYFVPLMARSFRSTFSDSLLEKKSQLDAARVGSEFLLNSIKEGPLPDQVDLRWLAPFVKDLKTKTIVDSKKEQRVQKTHHADDNERGRAILYTSSEESD